jgi:DNA polymerase-4
VAGHFSKQQKLLAPISRGDDIYRAALQLLAAREPGRDVGTLGVGLSGISEAATAQMPLFGEAAATPRSDRLESALDAIRDRFGEDAVQRARLLGRAKVVRDRIAFGNTGHPDERKPSDE